MYSILFNSQFLLYILYNISLLEEMATKFPYQDYFKSLLNILTIAFGFWNTNIRRRICFILYIILFDINFVFFTVFWKWFQK